MNETRKMPKGIGFLLSIVLLAVGNGCATYVSPGYVETYVPMPEVYVFGGYEYRHDEHRHDEREYSRRGEESRRSIGLPFVPPPFPGVRPPPPWAPPRAPWAPSRKDHDGRK